MIPHHQSAATVGEMIAAAIRRYPDRIAFVCEGREISYAALGRRIGQAIAGFEALGLARGDGVAQLSANRADMFCVIAACYMQGLRSVTLHALAGLADHAHILRDSGAKLLVAGPEHAGRVAQLQGLAEVPQLHWRSHGPGAAVPDFWAEAAEAVAPLRPRAHSGEVIRIAYTGGTTGRSKGVLLADRALMTNTLCWLAGFDWPDGLRCLCVAPISHGSASLILPTLVRGGCVVLHKGFDAAAFVAAVGAHRIGVTWLVPTMLYRLLDHLEAHPSDLSPLHALVYAAAPAAPERLAQALARLGPVLVQSYGQTEAPNTILLMSQADHLGGPARLGAAGRPPPGLSVEVLDDNDTPVPDGEAGELCVRGPLVMEGYLGRPEETAETLRGGWLHTGDIARRDGEGFFHIIDRKKDMIVTGGFNVYPRAVEDALAAHPGVAAAAVVGLADTQWGEAVTAFVVPRAGLAPEPSELVAWVREREGPVAAPKAVHLVAALPLTALGKIDKKALRAAGASPG